MAVERPLETPMPSMMEGEALEIEIVDPEAVSISSGDETFFEFDGYSAPINMMDETVFSNVSRYDMGQANYDKQKPQLRAQHNQRQQYQATVADFSIKATETLTGATNKALTNAMTANSKIAQVYYNDPEAFLKEAKAAEQNDTLSQFINSFN